VKTSSWIRPARRGLSLVLSLSLVLATPVPLFASPARAEFKPDFNLPAMQDYDPLLKDFAEAPWAPPRLGRYDAGDPILDQDPYFMRSQTYRAPFTHPVGRSGTAYMVHRGGIQIHVRGTPLALEIDQPLRPLFEVENFLFFQSTDKSMFLSRFPGGDDYSEGLFFIDKRYIETEMKKPADPRPVPVFFLPLAGGGWTGRIHDVSVEPLTVIALRNDEGEAVTIDLQMIEQIARVLHNNVVMATIMALKHDPVAIGALRSRWLAHAGGAIELPFALPPRGSTAAFGTFFTGVNLDRPEEGIEQVNGRGARVNLDFLPAAHGSDLLTPDVLDRLLFVGKITGTAYIVGLIAQYTILRERMKERRAYIESQEDQIARMEGHAPKKRSGPFFKPRREFRESIDVFSHGLATLSAGIGITSGFVLEYGADRFLKRPGRVGWVRWVLDKTLLYSRRQNEFIGANWQSFYLGVLILGGVDTVGVVLQLLYVSPIFFPWIAKQIGPEMHARISAQFSGAHAQTNNVLTSEVMRNFTGYFVAGAYQYSSSQRQALLEIVRPDVEKQMLREGKNPAESQHQKELNERIEERLELMLVERGLPSRKEFLFSAPSVIRATSQMMGYKVDREELKSSRDHSETGEPNFVLESARWGLLSHALKHAHQAAIELSSSRPGDERVLAAVRILKETKDKYHFVLNALKNPLHVVRALKDAKKVREMLTLFSYEGDIVGGAVKYLDLWDVAKVHPEAAVLAARLYRQALFSLIDDRPEYLRPNRADLYRYQTEAHAEAEARLRSASPEAGFDQADVEIETLEIVKQKTMAEQKRRQIAAWAPEGDDWLARAQTAKAHREAILAVQEAAGPEFEPTPAVQAALRSGRMDWLQAADDTQIDDGTRLLSRRPDLMDVYKETYRAALARTVGLHTAENAVDSGRLHRLRELVGVEEKVQRRFEPNPSYEIALRTGNLNLLGSLESLDAQIDRRIEAGLARRDPALVEDFREYRRGNIDLHERLEAMEGPHLLVERAKEAAENDIRQNMEHNPGWRQYHDQLDNVGRIRFLAHQYADAFLAKYVELTVSNSTVVGLTSEAQPGVFQKLRQLKLPRGDSFIGRSVRTVLRAMESPMDNTAYRAGLSGWLRRNVPWYQDAKTALQLNFRIMWVYLTIGYLTQYYIWQVKFTWPTALFFLWTGSLTSIVHYWTDRLMMNMGVRPMSNTWSKVKYSILYTWLTYPSYIPFFFYYESFLQFWSRWVTMPLYEFLEPAIKMCERLLSAVF
jgi:hypothetical protein